VTIKGIGATSSWRWLARDDEDNVGDSRQDLWLMP